MKKEIINVCLLIIFIVGLNQSVYANTLNHIVNKKCRSIYGDTLQGKVLNVNNKMISEYCVFLDVEKSIEIFKESNNMLLFYIKNRNNISLEFNKNTIEQYYEGLYNIIDDVDDVDMIKQIVEFQKFYDIYENESINAEIEDVVDAINNTVYIDSNNDTSDFSIYERLDDLTPHFSEKLVLKKDSIVNTKKHNNLVDVSKAVGYAEKYATSINLKYHYYSNGDCTNFLSQIFVAGGHKQNYTNNENTGWWFKREKLKDRASKTWRLANNFVEYFWNPANDTLSMSDFTFSAQKGDAAALDYSSDGSFDHLGYITAVSDNYSFYDNGSMCIRYRDIKISQHGGNYNEWISSNKNGWENSADNGTYLLIY